MATTTATITLNSSDILSQAISLSTSTTLYKGGTTATTWEGKNYLTFLLTLYRMRYNN